VAKSVERDPFGEVRAKLKSKYGLLKDAFLAISSMHGPHRQSVKGERSISSSQLQAALLELGGLSGEDVERVVSLADADTSGSIDYKVSLPPPPVRLRRAACAQLSHTTLLCMPGVCHHV